MCIGIAWDWSASRRVRDAAWRPKQKRCGQCAKIDVPARHALDCVPFMQLIETGGSTMAPGSTTRTLWRNAHHFARLPARRPAYLALAAGWVAT